MPPKPRPNISVYRGTTPTLKLTLDRQLQFSNFATFWVTIVDTHHELTIQMGDSRIVTDDENNTIYVSLKQEDTLLFDVGVGQLQVRFLFQSGKAPCTVVCDVHFLPILKEGVISANN